MQKVAKTDNLPALEVVNRAVRKALDKAAGMDIIAIYLHGSYATANQREESDIDLAVLAARPLALEQLQRIFVILQKEIGTGEIDIADLWSVNTVFAAQVVTTGQRIYTADPGAADRFEMLTLSKYTSLNEERAGILKDIKQRGRIFKEKVFLHE